MSAPATKPLGFAEHRITPAGLRSSIWVKAAARSRMTARESTLVDEPGTSHVSQAMRSASSSRFQLLAMAHAAACADSRTVKSQISGR